MNDPAPCWAPEGQHHHAPEGDSVTVLYENDVLMGRGVNTQYVGNVRFRQVVQSFKAVYAVAPRYRGKQAIAKLIYDEVCLQRQGRFLVERSVPCQDRCWAIVPTATALEKIMQTLRDKNRTPVKVTPTIGNTVAPWAVVDTPLIAAVAASASPVKQAASVEIDSRDANALSSDTCHWALFSSNDDASFPCTFHDVVEDQSLFEFALSTSASPSKPATQVVPTGRSHGQSHPHTCLHTPSIAHHCSRERFPSFTLPTRTNPLLGSLHHVRFTTSIPRTANSLNGADLTLTLGGPNSKVTFQFERHGTFHRHSSVNGCFPNTW